MSLVPIGQISNSSTIDSNQNPSPCVTKMKGILIKKINETSEILSTNETSVTRRFIGLHERDFQQLFGSNSQNELLTISKYIFKPVISTNVESGYAVVSHEVYETLDYNARYDENFAVSISKDRVKSLKKVAIENGSNKSVCVKDKKKFKQDILAFFKDKIIHLDIKYSFPWHDDKLIFKFESSDSIHFGLITENTKFVFRRYYDNKSFIFKENIIRDDEAIFKFCLDTKFGRTNTNVEYLEEEFYNKLKELIPLNSILVPYQTFSFTHPNSQRFIFFFETLISSRSFAGKQFNGNCLAFQFNGKCVIELIDEFQRCKIVKELTKKDQVGQSETKSEPKKEPPKKVEMTFSSFLKEKGMRGLPENLNDVIIPIITYYGPLKEFAIQCGINPQKGILLYGPPGTGKTSVGGHLAVYLGCPEENIQKISAPSLLSKWVGVTEGSLRNLFEKARTEYKSRGKDSNLHVIILDELEGFFGERKKAEKSWEKSRVDQFLTLLDGYESTPNILVIGITNHLKDLDEGLLREGRFGCQIYIGLPNKSERKEIYEEYLKVFKDNGRLPEDLDLEKLNELSEDFSGADIKGVVNTASQKAFTRVTNLVFENQITVSEAMAHPLNVITNKDFIEAAMKLVEAKKIKKNNI